MRLQALALANLLLAGFLLAIGWPGMLGDLRRLPAEATASAVERGLLVDEVAVAAALPALASAARTSPAAREDLALTLLAGANGEQAQVRLRRAVQEFRRYLAAVPGDSRAWASLAEAELRLDQPQPALRALDMSVLTAPRMPGLVLARCAMALDLYGHLDRDGRALAGEQFRFAAEDDTAALVRLVRARNALLLARVLLEPSPEAQAKFEAQWARS